MIKCTYIYFFEHVNSVISILCTSHKNLCQLMYMTLNKFLVSYIAISCQYGGRRLTSAPIVAWKCSFQVYFITWRPTWQLDQQRTDRPTDQTTNQQTGMRIHSGKIKSNKLILCYLRRGSCGYGIKNTQDIWFIVRNCAHITMFKFSGYLWIHI